MGSTEEVRLTLRPAARPVETEIRIGRGLLEGVAALLERHAPAPMYAIVSDETVAGLYGEAVWSAVRDAGHDAELLTFPPGEASKTLDQWGRLVAAFAESGLGRDGCVVAIGGGVTGDLAGFAAAAYARGVRLVQAPTSLLAMIDAAIGGKTGIDLRAGKNLAGAFHDPALVLVDTSTLHTLPSVELRAGLAEAVKHGAIADAGYFTALASSADAILALDPEAIHRLVVRSVEIKSGVVERDSREAGERAVLNFGHTIAHGIEKATEYAVPHGQAVAIGMIAEARIGERRGVTEPGTTDRLASLLDAFGLPVRIPPHVDPDALLAAARTDKKSREGRTHYSLISRIGHAAPASKEGWTHPVEHADVAPILIELGAVSRGESAV